MQSVRLLLFKCRGGDNAHWISKNKMAAMAVQWELCGTNLRENIANLGVSCYNGNNDRSARVLFVQHPREQGDWLRQNPRYARSGFDCIIRPAPSGAGRTTPSQPGHYSLINDLVSSPQPEGEARVLWWASHVVNETPMTNIEVSISILLWWNQINDEKTNTANLNAQNCPKTRPCI